MEQLVIGAGSLEICKITRAIKHSSSFSMLLQNWITFGKSLHVSEVNILELERKINLELLPLQEIPEELIQVWKAKKGSSATLKVLHDALVETGISDVAESLLQIFKFNVFGKLVTLEELLGEVSDPTERKINAALQICHHAYPDKPVHLLKDSVATPKQPHYYVERTVSIKIKLKQDVFTADSTKEHIFLVKGITKNKLAKLVNYQPVDTTGKQIHKITVRFMVLQDENDFGRICQKTSQPVHVVKLKDDCYYWLKSSSSIDAIQSFLEDDKLIYGENDFVKKSVAYSPPTSFIISDSPGMGKTLLLGHIAKLVQDENPNTIVLYFVLNEFIQKINSEIDSNAVIQTIACYSTPNEYCRLVMEETLRAGKHQFDIFLDAYDEVSADKIMQADKFLKFVKDLKNVRLYVTTRPHFKKKLESILNVISYEILPFNEKNQTEFLNKYWILEHKAKEDDMLKLFTEKCLKQIQGKMAKNSTQIAGIPLQCMMLAEVYADDASRYSTLKNEEEVTIEITSIYDIYKKLFDIKFGRIFGKLQACKGTWLRNSKEDYFQAHVYEAINLLFPNWITKFQRYLGGRNYTEESKMYSIGIIEKSHEEGTPRFVHRTFAEYLVADFVTRYFGKFTPCNELMLGVIFGKDGVKESTPICRPPTFNLEFPVLAYFIDCHLGSYDLTPTFDRLLLSAKNMEETICAAIVGCCFESLENCFELLAKSLNFLDKSKDDFIILRDRYFKYLPHICIESANTHIFLRNMLRVLQENFGTDLGYHMYTPQKEELEMRITQTESIDNYRYPYIPNCTPLHVACYHGNFNVVTNLVKLYAEEVRHLKYLLHVCVRDSYTNNETTIDDKILIIQLLSNVAEKYDVNWLEERFEETGCTPLLQDRVHFKLVQCLAEMGVDISACSNKHGTILHRFNDMDKTINMLQFVVAKGFKAINSRNAKGLTSLHNAIDRFGVINDEILNLFHKAKANFNCVDHNGNPLLSYVIKTGSPKFLKAILKYGTDINTMNNQNFSAAHWVIQSAITWRPSKLKAMLEALMSVGFNHIDKANFKGITPLLYAVQYKGLKVDLLEFFHINGANFNAEDLNGNSVLFYAVLADHVTEILQKILGFGASKLHLNSKKQNVMHIACSSANFWAVSLFADERVPLLSPDVDGNLPIHLLFQTESEHNSDILIYPQLLKSGFEAENHEGNIPLVEWLKKSQNPLRTMITLAEFKDRLPMTPQVASKAFTTILGEQRILNSFLNEELGTDEKTIFVAIFNFLLENEGKLLMDDGSTFQWEKLDSDRLNILDMYLLNAEMLNDVMEKIKTDIKSDKETLSIKTLVELTNIQVEVLFVSLLDCERYKMFMEICDVLTKPPGAESTSGLDTTTPSERSLSFIPNCTPIHISAYNGDYTAINEFLGKDRDAFLKAKYIMHACTRDSEINNELVIANKIEIIRLLHKENPNWLEEQLNGDTPLVQQKVHLKLLQELVSLGADINAVSSEGETVLFKTNDETNFVEILKWALQNGFKLINDQANLTRYSPLMYAILVFGELSNEMLNLFHEAGADFNAYDNKEDSVLSLAIVTGSVDFIRKIIEYGADVNHKNTEQEHAAHDLISAVTMRKFESSKILELLELFVSKGFNYLDKPDSEGLTPFQFAMQIEHLPLEVVDFFLTNGANVHYEDGNGWTVLFHAIFYNQSPECILKILESGANINHQDSDKRNVAHILIDCANQNRIDSKLVLTKLKSFILNGFNLINGATSDGLTPLSYLIELDDLDLDLLKFFHENGANFNVKYEDGSSILLDAIYDGHNETIISQIIQYGADLNHVNSRERNALHVAAICGNYPVMQFLIDEFDVNSKDSEGNTPLHLLFLKDGKSYEASLKLLLKKGGSLHDQNKFLCNPFLKWIHDGKSPISELAKLMDLMVINGEIASKALTILVGRETLLKKHLINSSEEEKLSLVQFIKFLMENGATFLLRDGNRGHVFDWRKLSQESLNKLDKIKIGDSCKFIQANKACSEISILNLVNQSFVNIPPESIMTTFLSIQEYDKFLAFCGALSLGNVNSDPKGMIVIDKESS